MDIEIALPVRGVSHLDELDLCGLSTSRRLLLLGYNAISNTLQRLLLLNHPLDNLLLDQLLIFVEILL